ncbi:MAG: choice-of-anchor D domain-containing protein [Spirochaetota bacterium]
MKKPVLLFILISLGLFFLTSCFTRVEIYEKATSAPDINIKELAGEKSIFDYSSLEIFTEESRVFTIENTGSETLRITGLGVSGGDITQFALDTGTLSSVVPAEGSTCFSVTFKPTRIGEKTLTIIIVSNDPDEGNFEFTLTGDALASTTKTGPDIKVLNCSTEILQGDVGMDFGEVEVGHISSSVSFYLENNGDSDLMIYDIYLTGTDSDHFDVDDSSTSYTLASGRTAKLPVCFQPQSTEEKQASLVILSDDPDEEEFSFILNGYGSAVPQPDINVQQADTQTDILNGYGAYDFGTVEVDKSSSVTLNIQNTGTADLTLNSITYPTGFTGTALPSIPIAPDGSADFSLTFEPTADTDYSGPLKIESNDPDEIPYRFTVSGTGSSTGVPDINVMQDSLTIQNGGSYDFGSVLVGTSKQVEFTVENKGTSDLIVDTITSGDSVQFSVDQGSMTVAAGTTQTLSIAFSPQAPGLCSTTITLESNDPDETTYTFTVEGTGSTESAPNIEVWQGTTQNVNSCYFGEVPAGDEGDPVVFTIKNTGDAQLDITSIFLSKGMSEYYLDTTSTSFSLDSMESTDFTLTFTPQGTGKRKGTLEIHSNDNDTSKYKIRLEGEGL